jgi:hypothetical protein
LESKETIKETDNSESIYKSLTRCWHPRSRSLYYIARKSSAKWNQTNPSTNYDSAVCKSIFNTFVAYSNDANNFASYCSDISFSSRDYLSFPKSLTNAFIYFTAYNYSKFSSSDSSTHNAVSGGGQRV